MSGCAKDRTALVLVPERMGRSVVTRTLEAEGMQVLAADDPFGAMALVLSTRIHLIVLSLDSVTRRDRALLREARRILPDVRVLLLVPEGRRRDVSAFLEAGADALLPHPLFADELRLLACALLRSEGSDPLTGLPNRGAYERAFERELRRARRNKEGLCLILLDIDHFKQVNTDIGYRAADVVLREVARRLRKAFRVPDIVARWGGEEFAVLLTGTTGDEKEACQEAREALERAFASVRTTPIETHQGERSITLSAGVACFPWDGDSRADLFDIANRRLKKAKDGGRDRFVLGCDEKAEDGEGGGDPGPAAVPATKKR